MGSGDPQFEEMRGALLQFERSSYQAASSKERAFYSALRTLLADVTVTKEDEARATHITAAYKWFSKHRYGGGKKCGRKCERRGENCDRDVQSNSLCCMH